jgi:hypothetical protein
MLPKVENLYPNKPDPNAKGGGRKLLNRITLQFWDDWVQTCIKHNIDPEAEWKRQRNYLYDLYYKARGYTRTRKVKEDNRKHNGRNKNHRKPKPDLLFSKEWLSNANGNGGYNMN